MLEEQGRVVALEDENLWVETRVKTSCSSCAVKSGCGTSSLAKVFSPRLFHTRLSNTLNAKVGDQVIIGIDESSMVKGSLLLYLIPLIAMLTFSVIAVQFQWQEGWQIAFAAVGLAVGLALARLTAHRLIQKEDAQPILIKRLPQHIPLTVMEGNQ